MKKILLVAMFLPVMAFAEYQTLNKSDSLDKLEQLGRTLGGGDYAHPESFDFGALEELERRWYEPSCEKDRFNGLKTCSISKKNLIVMIINGKPFVLISGGEHGHYPRSQSAIKIDNNKTIYGVEGDFSNNEKIINQMIKGRTVYTRYTDWPYNVYRDDEIELDGFTEAYQKLKQEYAKIK